MAGRWLAAQPGRLDHDDRLRRESRERELLSEVAVALNRVIAIGEVQGPAAALALVDDLDLDNYYPFHATRADPLRRLGRHIEAAVAYERAATIEGRQDPCQPDSLLTETRFGWAAQPGVVHEVDGGKHPGVSGRAARDPPARGRGSGRP
jgi:hypothetical protein